eukprot:snap_masked-scaffold112_size353035-processed-gene-0.4 protein:Tk07391 transcript:snap_masked-scaffold112_size353035-processed-gene-0.4-mRNA-1 annotation:"hypothetical protein"
MEEKERGNGGARNGTCYTQNECMAKGGTVAGNCAAGPRVESLFQRYAGKTRVNMAFIAILESTTCFAQQHLCVMDYHE